MTHSVSHNLVLELNGTDLSIATVKKDGLVVDLRFFPLVDKQILENVLAQLPEIYSDITLLIRNKDFITVPEIFYTSNTKKLFSLSHNLPNEDKLCLDKLEHNIGILYAVDISLTDAITAKFPRINIQHEATIILKKLFKEVNFKQARILISINSETIVLYAIKEGKLLLCNSYQARSNDDIFYFVMLTVEQLHYLPAETELVILGEPPVRAEIFELFKNYIKEINIWMEEFQIAPEIKYKELLSRSFALQTMVCE